jgi:Flp pilus assembly protein TadD
LITTDTNRGKTGCQTIATLMISASLLTGCAGTDLKLTELSQSLVSEKSVGALDPSSGIETGSVSPSKPAQANATDAQAIPQPVLSEASKTALQQARQFKAAKKLKEALAVLETIPNEGGSNHPLLIEQGMLALELGQSAKAQQLLNRTQPDTSKDWKVHSALGVAAASQGQQQEAQRYFWKALKLSPDNPTVMNNLALSFILDQKPTEAENLLKRAQGSKSYGARVTQNLALAQTLSGS